MPELPEIQAHAERLEERFGGRRLESFQPLRFTALKTATPAPDAAYGSPLRSVGRRGKYLLFDFEPATFVIHLMQGGRLSVDKKRSAKPRGGQARLVFEPGEFHGEPDDAALLLTEQGTERRAGVWVVDPDALDTSPPLDRLGPDAATVDAEQLTQLFASTSMRIHGFLRDQQMIAGIGRRLANEICHRAKVSPFATTKKLGPDGATAIAEAMAECIAEDLDDERTNDKMSSSKDRPRAVHGRTGEPCPVCGDTVRAVEYSGYTVNYCATCQTGGKVLADNTTSKFLK